MIWREVVIPALLIAAEPEAKGFQTDVVDGHLSVFVSRLESEGWHLSISHRRGKPGGKQRPGRYPRWDEIAEARDKFLPSDLTFGMILPPVGQYVNVHPTTFHLWEWPADREAVDAPVDTAEV